jgi:hypothetical protein
MRPYIEQYRRSPKADRFSRVSDSISVYGWNLSSEGSSAPFSVKNAPGVVLGVANWVPGKALA